MGDISNNVKLYVCIDKTRNKNGKIVEYTLEDIIGDTVRITPSELKDAISKKTVKVPNLTLTSDGRLIDNGALERVQAQREAEHKEFISNKEMQHKLRKEMKDRIDSAPSSLVESVKRLTKKFFESMGINDDIVIASSTVNNITNILGADIKDKGIFYQANTSTERKEVWVCVAYSPNDRILGLYIQDKKTGKVFISTNAKCLSQVDVAKNIRNWATELKKYISVVPRHTINDKSTAKSGTNNEDSCR